MTLVTVEISLESSGLSNKYPRATSMPVLSHDCLTTHQLRKLMSLCVKIAHRIMKKCHTTHGIGVTCIRLMVYDRMFEFVACTDTWPQ